VCRAVRAACGECGGNSEATRAYARAEGPVGRGRGERAEARSRVYIAARGEPGECGGGAVESKRTIPPFVCALYSRLGAGIPCPTNTNGLDDSVKTILTASRVARDRAAASSVIVTAHIVQSSSYLSPRPDVCAFAAVHILCGLSMKQSA